MVSGCADQAHGGMYWYRRAFDYSCNSRARAGLSLHVIIWRMTLVSGCAVIIYTRSASEVSASSADVSTAAK